MVIKGFQKVSLIDYPGKVAAVVFVAGCNFRCPYCYNRDLVLGFDSLPTISEEEVLAYLKKRKRLLDGVVLTGGEPTLQKDLLEFLDKIDKIPHVRFFVKIDTNGSNSLILSSMIENGFVDYVALDIKAPLDQRYKQAVGLRAFDVSFILSSMKELVSSGIDYELRTTVVPGLHLEKDLLDLARQLKEILTSHLSSPTSPVWYLQNFQPKNCLNPEFEKVEPYDKMFLEKLVEKLRAHMPNVSLR